jgi:putative chitinase
MADYLSPHFSLEELTITETGIDNTPDASMEANLVTLAVFLEKVRVVLGGNPIIVNSAYRSPAVNAAVGGVPNDAHEKGDAADITAPAFGTPFEVAQALDAAMTAGKLGVDQLIYEQTWVHVSRDPQLRGERLTLVGPGAYTTGIVGP